ncbi:MAG: hypothetical protein IPP40_14810 [bacterium]|nr:hypothetical protein [bacterium]
MFGEAGGVEKVTTSELQAWAKMSTGTSNTIRSFLTSWGTSMRVWFEQEKF